VIPGIKGKWKHHLPESMEYSEYRSKREVYSFEYLPILKSKRQGLLVHVYNLSTWESWAKGSTV
jgi:hypothetical protein